MENLNVKEVREAISENAPGRLLKIIDTKLEYIKKRTEIIDTRKS